MIRRVVRNIISRGVGTIRSIFVKSQYYIKSGYTHRSQVVTFDDSPNKDEWQREVYQYGKDLLIKKGYSRIIDFGCGSGFKLMQNFADFDTLGFELNPAVDLLKTKYPQRKWEVFNRAKSYSCDILMMSDVIEHIEDPAALLKRIDKLIDFKTMIISTPDRNLLKLNLPFGPPRNVSHYREWSFREFHSFINSYFDVTNHFISNEKQATQVIECRKRND